MLDLSGGSALLHPDACRLLPLFGKTRFVDDHNGGLVAEMLKGVRAQIIAHAIGIPDSAGEQSLHPIRARFSGVFGQLPAVFARGVTEDSVQKRERTTTRFWPGKARSDPGMQAIQFLDPSHNISDGRLGFLCYGGGVMLQVLLLSHGLLGWGRCS